MAANGQPHIVKTAHPVPTVIPDHRGLPDVRLARTRLSVGMRASVRRSVSLAPRAPITSAEGRRLRFDASRRGTQPNLTRTHPASLGWPPPRGRRAPTARPTPASITGWATAPAGEADPSSSNHVQQDPPALACSSSATAPLAVSTRCRHRHGIDNAAMAAVLITPSPPARPRRQLPGNALDSDLYGSNTDAPVVRDDPAAFRVAPARSCVRTGGRGPLPVWCCARANSSSTCARQLTSRHRLGR